jgi:hypothetical protein
MQEITDPGDITGDVTWMTYAELGKARGIDPASTKRLAIRRHWRRQRGNDGTARVAVPVTEATPRESKTEDDTGDVPSDITSDVTPFHAKALAALEDAVAVLREQLEAERQQVQAANGRPDKAEAAVAGERSRSDVLRSRLDEMIEARAEADRASAEERLRADAAHAATQAAQQAAEHLRPTPTGRRGAS